MVRPQAPRSKPTPAAAREPGPEPLTSAGDLALVLHAHLPYVRSSEPGSLEEDWYFQALQECYLPLLAVLEAAAAAADSGQHARLTLGLSPTLLSLLADRRLNARFLPWLVQRQQLLERAPAEHAEAAAHLGLQLEQVEQQWLACEGQLVPRFRQLQQQGVVDLITCGATHGYLPLLREVPEAVRAQLLNAVREHERQLGERPLGIWLPECAYYEGLDQQLVEVGLRYSVLDGHGLLHALPRPRYGVFAPICSPAGVAFFGRDGNATLPVWSAREGYPGDGLYREFHRDMGWDLPEEELQQLGIRSRRPPGPQAAPGHRPGLPPRSEAALPARGRRRPHGRTRCRLPAGAGPGVAEAGDQHGAAAPAGGPLRRRAVRPLVV